MQEKEITILILTPFKLNLKIRPTTTIRDLIHRLEQLGFDGIQLGAEPENFLYTPNERIFNKITDQEVVYGFPEKGGD